MMYSDYSSEKGASRLLHRVYAWMGGALAITGATAWGVANYPPAISFIFQTPMVVLLLFIAQIGLVMYLSFRIQKMTLQTAVATFLSYSFLTGLTLSSIFLVYTHQSIAVAFFICAGMFVAMSLYGIFTRADLSSMGSFLFMGLMGLILCMVVNIFLQSAQFDFFISLVGVGIFTLLTAYDVQQIKRIGDQMSATGAPLGKVAIIGALKLYLDFINLFLFLLVLNFGTFVGNIYPQLVMIPFLSLIFIEKKLKNTNSIN